MMFEYRDVDEKNEWMMNSIRDRHKEELKKSIEKNLKRVQKLKSFNNARKLLNQEYNQK